MRLALAIVPVLFSSFLSAQTTPRNTISAEYPLPQNVTQIESCPVSLSVKREGQATVLNAVRSGELPPYSESAVSSANQGLGVTVAGAHGAIKSLDFVVYGQTSGMHILPVSRNAQEIEETVHLSDFNGQPVVDSRIWTTHVAMISRVRLTGIEYADGTTWHTTSANACVAVPSLFVLVNSAAR